jgi:CBS domain-containing protein
MFVRHYMVRSAATVLDTDTLGAALAIMVKHHRQQLLVVDAKGNYVGEVTTFLLAKMLLPKDADTPQSVEDAEGETVIDIDDRITPHLGRKVSEFAVRETPVVYLDTPLVEAVKLLAGGRLRLPVVDHDNKKFLGAISSLTVLRRYQF